LHYKELKHNYARVQLDTTILSPAKLNSSPKTANVIPHLNGPNSWRTLNRRLSSELLNVERKDGTITQLVLFVSQYVRL